MSTSPMNAAIRFRCTEPLISPNMLVNVQQVLDQRHLSPGLWVSVFEDRWKAVCGVQHAVAMSSGTAALHVAMLAAGLGPGDEVIVPAMTCPDTLNAVAFTGATPVIVDIERLRFGMDPQRVRDALTARTKALVPVHLYGCPVAPEIFQIGRERGLLVIEDAAEAHGADLDGKMIGSLGTIGCFSFRGDKVLGVGTGGMVTTDDAQIAQRCRDMLGTGSAGGFDRFLSTHMGYGYELSNVSAAIGAAQIEMLEETVRMKRAIAGWYETLLSPGILEKPPVIAGHVWWRYGVLLNGADPRVVHHALMDRGIETLPPFTPMYRIPMYAQGLEPRDFPVAEDVYVRALVLPISPYLRQSDVREIATTLQELLMDGRS